ncbi:hypothetical protein MPER_12646, partial [Moniliophthora perniciosa FA553]
MVRPSFATLLIAFASTVLALQPPVEKRAQCAATLNIALSVAHRLQDHYYDSGTGQLNGGSLWTDANTLEDLHNLMLATGTDDFRSVADNSFLGRAANNANTNWNSFLGGSNDDAGWIVLALWKMADYKAARGLSNSAFLSSADKIYNIIAGQWDDHCGGGGYLRGRGQAYLDNAKKTWNWLKNSGMRNSDNLWNDGLTDNCANNGQTTWTYNQGVIASGLANLAVATGDTSLLAEAEKTLDATISHLTTNNILRESCDNAASGGAVCNQDQQIFKGLWTKHLQFYLDAANDPARTAKYSPFLGSQTSAVFHFGTNAQNDIGSVWYAPDQ